MVYQTEKTLTDLGDKVSGEEKAQIQVEIDKVKEALKGTDLEQIKAATEELTKKFYEVSAKLYQQAGGQPGAGFDPSQAQGQAQQGPGGENVYDADYKVVDEDKK